MAYLQFAKDKPVITDLGGEVIDDTRGNLMALRDGLIAGVLQGWTMTQTGANPEQPDVITYANDVERVRLTVTWGSSGGSTGNPTVIVYAYSGNSGAAYDNIGTLTHTWDSGGNLTGMAWS